MLVPSACKAKSAAGFRAGQLLIVATGLIWVVICPACSRDNSTRLSGLVTLDGAPMKKGSIGLTPRDGKGPTAEAIITDGKYSLKTWPGPKLVVIHGLKKVGTRRFHEDEPSSPMVDVNEESLPARYHSQSRLEENLNAGEQTLNFDLTSGAN